MVSPVEQLNIPAVSKRPAMKKRPPAKKAAKRGGRPNRVADPAPWSSGPWDARVQFRTEGSGASFAYRPNQLITRASALDALARFVGRSRASL